MKALFEKSGAHVLVDGQFGSTGKGTLAAWLAHRAHAEGALDYFEGAISSSGPNSGHTSYFGNDKIVLKQLPTFAVHSRLLGNTVPAYLSAGAIINPKVLAAEAEMFPLLPIYVHPNAAIVTQEALDTEKTGSVMEIASTQSGTGAALARKIMRHPDAIARNSLGTMPRNVSIINHKLHPGMNAYFVEVAQGFSLGINSEFYPHATSRECTVMQALADARFAPRFHAKTYMAIRTFPIRVGNLQGFSSGDWYDDQKEVSWESLGQTPELTTVTKRIRRVATFSEDQYVDALVANDPDFVFINFMNYLPKEQQQEMLDNIKFGACETTKKPVGVIAGYGPKIEDVELVG